MYRRLTLLSAVALSSVTPGAGGAQEGEGGRVRLLPDSIAELVPDARIRWSMGDAGPGMGLVLSVTTDLVVVDLPDEGPLELPLPAIDSLWVQGTAARKGLWWGAAVGGAAGGVLVGLLANVACESSCGDAFIGGFGVGVVAGALGGGLSGLVVGSAIPVWHLEFP